MTPLGVSGGNHENVIDLVPISVIVSELGALGALKYYNNTYTSLIIKFYYKRQHFGGIKIGKSMIESIWWKNICEFVQWIINGSVSKTELGKIASYINLSYSSNLVPKLPLYANGTQQFSVQIIRT